MEEYQEYEMNKHNLSNLTLATKANNSSISNNVFSIKKESLAEDVQIKMNVMLREYSNYSRELLNARMKYVIKNFFKTFNENIEDDSFKVNEETRSHLDTQEEFIEEAERTSVTKESNFS